MYSFSDPDDYEFISSLIVPPEIVSIPIVFDNIEEPDETFTVRLVPIPDQNLEGILISPDVATITIISKWMISHNYVHISFSKKLFS